MSQDADRPGALAANSVAGLANFPLMSSDPVWKQLAPQFAALQALVIDLQAKHNALVAALVAGSVTGANVDQESSLPAPDF